MIELTIPNIYNQTRCTGLFGRLPYIYGKNSIYIPSTHTQDVLCCMHRRGLTCHAKGSKGGNDWLFDQEEGEQSHRVHWEAQRVCVCVCVSHAIPSHSWGSALGSSVSCQLWSGLMHLPLTPAAFCALQRDCSTSSGFPCLHLELVDIRSLAQGHFSRALGLITDMCL